MKCHRRRQPNTWEVGAFTSVIAMSCGKVQLFSRGECCKTRLLGRIPRVRLTLRSAIFIGCSTTFGGIFYAGASWSRTLHDFVRKHSHCCCRYAFEIVNFHDCVANAANWPDIPISWVYFVGLPNGSYF